MLVSSTNPVIHVSDSESLDQQDTDSQSSTNAHTQQKIRVRFARCEIRSSHGLAIRLVPLVRLSNRFSCPRIPVPFTADHLRSSSRSDARPALLSPQARIFLAGTVRRLDLHLPSPSLSSDHHLDIVVLVQGIRSRSRLQAFSLRSQTHLQRQSALVRSSSGDHAVPSIHARRSRADLPWANPSPLSSCFTGERAAAAAAGQVDPGRLPSSIDRRSHHLSDLLRTLAHLREETSHVLLLVRKIDA